MIDNLLDKSAKRKLDFVRILETASDFSVSKIELQEIMGISEFICNQIVEELLLDFEEYNLNEYFNIKISGAEIVLFESHQANSELLLEILVKHSLKFNLLLDIYMNDDLNINEFAEDNFISLSTMYKMVKELKSYMAQFGIEITKKFDLIGPEESIRYFFYNLFNKVDRNADIMYPKTMHLGVGDIVDRLVFDTGLSCKKLSRNKLFHYIDMAVHRHKFTDYSVVGYEEIDIYSRESIIWQSVYMSLENIGVLSREAIEKETIVIMGILLTEHMLDVSECVTIPDNSRLHVYVGDFITEYNKVFQNDMLLKHTEEEFGYDLMIAAYGMFAFSPNNMWMPNNLEITYFEETYGEHFYFCRDYIINCELDKVEEYRQHLFYSYLLVLIKHVSLSNVSTPVTVCVDFGLGLNYVEFIKENMMFLNSINIEFKDDYREADLVLTDSPSTYEDVDNKIVWLAPPRATDWTNLANYIVKIRNGEI